MRMMIPPPCFCPWCGAINQGSFPQCYRCGLEVIALPEPIRAEQPLRLSRLVKGRYLVQRCLSIGEIEVVYEAWDTALQHSVLLKEARVPPGLPVQQREARTRFLQQAEAEMQGQFPHLPLARDLFAENGEWYLVTERLAENMPEESE